MTICHVTYYVALIGCRSIFPGSVETRPIITAQWSGLRLTFWLELWVWQRQARYLQNPSTDTGLVADQAHSLHRLFLDVAGFNMLVYRESSLYRGLSMGQKSLRENEKLKVGLNYWVQDTSTCCFSGWKERNLSSLPSTERKLSNCWTITSTTTLTGKRKK